MYVSISIHLYLYLYIYISPELIRDFPLYRISLYNGFPFIKDFPAQGTSLDRSGLACPSAGLQSPASGLFIKQQRILEVLNV